MYLWTSRNYQRVFLRTIIAFIAMLFLTSGYAVVDAYEFSSVEQEQRFYSLTHELRCPKCQNQSIGDSNAPIARDLRREVYRMLTEEQADDQQVIEFMLDRYGDFVLYTPRFTGTNMILWLGPMALLFIALMALVMILRSHRAKRQPGAESVSSLTPEQQARIDKIMEDKQS